MTRWATRPAHRQGEVEVVPQDVHVHEQVDHLLVGGGLQRGAVQLLAAPGVGLLGDAVGWGGGEEWPETGDRRPTAGGSLAS